MMITSHNEHREGENEERNEIRREKKKENVTLNRKNGKLERTLTGVRLKHIFSSVYTMVAGMVVFTCTVAVGVCCCHVCRVLQLCSSVVRSRYT